MLDPQFWRMGVLMCLLDAVAAAMAGGPAVVLGVQDPDRGAQWVGAVSRLMSAGTARRLCFSTLERTDALAAGAAAGLHLMCVPRDDLPRLSPEVEHVVIDEEELVTMGGLSGEPHVTEHGSHVAAGTWSGLAQVVLQDGSAARRALAELDELALRVGDRDLSPVWPLAVVALCHPEEFADAQQEAVVAVLDRSPGLAEHPDLAAVVTNATRTVLTDTAATWAVVDRAAAGGWSPMAGFVLGAYLESALQDPAWLTRAGGVPLPDLTGRPAPVIDLRVRDAVLDSLGRRAGLVADGDASAPDLALECLRTIDLVVRAGLTGDGLQVPGHPAVDVGTRLEILVERIVVPVALDPVSGPLLATAVGGVAIATRDLVYRVLVSALGGSPLPVGERVPPVVAGWLVGPSGEPDADMQAALDRWSGADELAAERLLQVHAAALAAGDGRTWVPAALVVRLARVPAGPPAPRDEDLLTALAGSAGLGVGDALALARRFGGVVPPAAYVPVLAAADDDEDTAALCRLLDPAAWDDGLLWAQRPDRGPVERLVRMRGAVRQRWWLATDSAQLATTACHVYANAAWLVGFLDPGAVVADVLVAHAQAAWTLAMIARPETAVLLQAQPQLLGRVLIGDMGILAGEIVAGGLRAPVALALAVAAGDPQVTSFVPAGSIQIDGVRATARGITASLLDYAVRRHLDTGADPDVLVDEAYALSRSWPAVPAGADPERSAAAWQKSIEAHVRGLTPKGRLHSATLGRFRRG